MWSNLRTSVIALFACGLLALPAAAVAQAQPETLTDEHDLTHCSIVGVLSGASVASSEVGPVFGGMVGWPLTNRLGLEASAAWSDRPNDGNAFAAGITLRHNFGLREGVVPYLKGGAGLYISTVDSGRGTPPEFYRHRFGPGNGQIAATRHTFTDPAAVIGGGVQWFVGERFAIRPEVEAFVVRGASRTMVVTSVLARFEYHFEDIRITQ